MAYKSESGLFYHDGCVEYVDDPSALETAEEVPAGTECAACGLEIVEESGVEEDELDLEPDEDEEGFDVPEEV